MDKEPPLTLLGATPAAAARRERIFRTALGAQLAAQIKRYPPGVLPPSTITKSARKGKRWALEIVKTWIAKKQADEILGHREIQA